jgi:hypothetical protein
VLQITVAKSGELLVPDIFTDEGSLPTRMSQITQNI